MRTRLILILALAFCLSAIANVDAGWRQYSCSSNVPCSYTSGCIVSGAIVAQQGIIRHADGTYWKEGMELELGAISDSTSATGWRQWWYPKAFSPAGALPQTLSGFQPLSRQGPSIWGYTYTRSDTYGQQPTYQDFAAAYSQDDSQVLNEAGRLTEQAQQLAGEAHGHYLQLAGIKSESKKQIAAIFARGVVAAQVLRSLDGPPLANTTQTFTLSSQFDPATGRVVTPQAQNGSLSPATTAMLDVIKGSNCLNCHSPGPKLKEGMPNLTLVLTFNSQQFGKILDAVGNPDEKKRMPLSADLSPGIPLAPPATQALQNYKAELDQQAAKSGQ